MTDKAINECAKTAQCEDSQRAVTVEDIFGAAAHALGLLKESGELLKHYARENSRLSREVSIYDNMIAHNTGRIPLRSDGTPGIVRGIENHIERMQVLMGSFAADRSKERKEAEEKKIPELEAATKAAEARVAERQRKRK